MKGIIMQDFSIGGLRKQWEWQNEIQRTKDIIGGQGITNFNYGSGCKTETRRTRGLDEINENPDGWELWSVFVEDGKDVNPMVLPDGKVVWNFANTGEFKNHQIAIQCPYGVVGDELWVKEAWSYLLLKTGDRGYVYKADGDVIGQWRSPLIMPKAASRIRLEITGIKLERLQDITEEGALREGVYPTGERGAISTHGDVADFYQIGDGKGSGTVILSHTSARNTYLYAFGHLHGEELRAKNPWVWVIQFTVKEFK